VQRSQQGDQITAILFRRRTNSDVCLETWETTAKATKNIDVFHRRYLRRILGISWRDHITNDEVVNRRSNDSCGQMALHGTVATR